MAKFKVNKQEFNMALRDTRSFKEFINAIPDTASYRIDVRDEGIFFSTYWIGVNDTIEDLEPVVTDVYTIEMPSVCVYGKSAYEIISAIHPQDGIPFVLNATDTIDLSRGFIDILFRKMKEYQTPYIVVKGWVKEHIQMLEEVNSNHKLVVRSFKDDVLV